MIKKLVYWFNQSRELDQQPHNFPWSLVQITPAQYSIEIALRVCRVPRGLWQYYADLLMLELVEQGVI